MFLASCREKKGTLPSVSIHNQKNERTHLVFGLRGLVVRVVFVPQTTQAQEDVVINEVNLVTGPNYSQFVELYGEPNASLEGTSLVILKSLQVSGAWTALVQSVVGLDTLSLDAEDSWRWRALGGKTP